MKPQVRNMGFNSVGVRFTDLRNAPQRGGLMSGSARARHAATHMARVHGTRVHGTGRSGSSAQDDTRSDEISRPREFRNAPIADSARLLGDSTSAVSVHRLCGSARVALGGPRRSPRRAVQVASMLCGRVGAALPNLPGYRRLVAPPRGAGSAPASGPSRSPYWRSS